MEEQQLKKLCIEALSAVLAEIPANIDALLILRGDVFVIASNLPAKEQAELLLDASIEAVNRLDEFTKHNG